METPDLEGEIVGLLVDLSAAQDELLDFLGEKRRLMAASDTAGLDGLAPREQALVARLQACHDRRSVLLAQAAEQRLASVGIRALAQVLPDAARCELAEQIRTAEARSRLLSHQSLANWVLIQRNLLHVSQALELIAKRIAQ